MNEKSSGAHANRIRIGEVPAILEQVSRMEQEERTLPGLLRLLSERLRCSLLLEETGRHRILATWPPEATETAGNKAKAGDAVSADTVLALREKRYRLRLTTAADRRMDEAELSAALEIVRLYILIWDQACMEEDQEALVRAIIKNDRVRLLEAGRKLGFDFRKPKDLWILRMDRQEEENLLMCSETQWMALLQNTLDFFRESPRMALAARYDRSILVFADSMPYAELEEGLEEEWIKRLDEGARLYTFRGIASPAEVRKASWMVCQYETILEKIYRERIVFSGYDLHFAEICKMVLENGGDKAGGSDSLVACLREEEGGELLRTLETYYLDAEGNSQKTGEILFMHNNTVKYRLHKIRQKLGVDITKMPTNYNIYLALALERLAKVLNEKKF
ncbi:MAG: helix-turn-helix domain-containing protein [Christensenella sp.]|nr:helix-turn-helix domain-containing protein [Christensenella sp.]